MLLPGTAERYVATEEDVLGEWQRRAPEYAEYLRAHVEDAFERTTTGEAMTAHRVAEAEGEAYGNMAPVTRERMLEHSMGGWDPWQGGNAPKFIAKEEWNERNPLYRKGIDWREEFTPERAAIYAEEYDKREFRKLLLQQGKDAYGFMKGSVPGFFAGILGSLPDPVNFIPFGRAAGAGKGALAGIKTGMLEGAVGNAVTDAFVLPSLKSRGADVGIADFALDITFGAAIGGLLGGAGGALGARREAKAAEVTRAARAMREAESAARALEHEQTHGAFTSAGRDRFFEAEPFMAAGRAAEPVPFEPLDSLLTRNDPVDYARQRIHGEDRQTLLRAMDAAYDDFTNGRPVDVGQILAESNALSRMYEQALFNPLLAADPHSPSVRLMYAQLADELGVGLGDVHVDMGTGMFNARGRMEVARETSFGMVKFIWLHGEASPEPVKMRVTKEDVTGFPALLREYAPAPHEQGGYRWTVQAPDGRMLRYVAKNFADTDDKSHLVTVHVITKGQAKRDGLSKRIADLVSPQEGLLPSREIPQGALTNQAYAPPRASLGQKSAIHQIGSRNIDPHMGEVNRFIAETPGAYTPAPPVDPEIRAALDELGVDPRTGLTMEEVRAGEQIAQGKANPEEADLYLRANEEEALRQKMEEAGFAVMDCIMEAQ